MTKADAMIARYLALNGWPAPPADRATQAKPVATQAKPEIRQTAIAANRLPGRFAWHGVNVRFKDAR
jgi:hypothetical protein